MKELPAIVAALHDATAMPAVLATLVSVEGSSYRRPGARLLLAADGRRLGSISGGCLEEDVCARARRVRESGVPEAVVYDTTSENDLVWGVGLGCHGVVRVLLERLSVCPAWAARLQVNFAARRPTRLSIRHAGEESANWGTQLRADTTGEIRPGIFDQTVPPPTALVIFGAGDDAMPLVRLGKELGWQVTVADPRPAFVTATRFPLADACVVGPADKLADLVAPDAATLAVVMTHHYVHDVPLLRTLLHRPLAYLGLLGPKKRAERILADLAAAGMTISAERRADLHAPVGLDLGADSPEQVALAIVAEMQAVLSGRDAGPLRQRTRPIHEEACASQDP
jgi:xanthine/CO dehydrogenase XdhC/CoxF family maturation factor